jgi:hypothetical protein
MRAADYEFSRRPPPAARRASSTWGQLDTCFGPYRKQRIWIGVT